MFKFAISFLLLINFVIIHAQTWTESEINALQSFALKNRNDPVDSSNQYLNNPAAIDLGKALFNDKHLSSNGNVSCSSCHIEKYAFTDDRKLAFGLSEGFRNTPTLLNISLQHWYFADGAKDSLWTQALSSIENPAEQNFTRMEMMHYIADDNNYRMQYQKIFKQTLPLKAELNTLPAKAGPNAKLEDLIAWKKLSKSQRHMTNVVFSNIGKTIAAYVSTIKSKATRFDDFIDELNEKGTSKILTNAEQRGLRLFISQESGCANCHSGPLFSNKSFHDIGTGIPGQDNGRSEVIESVIRDEFNCLSEYSDAKPSECMELNYINRDKHSLTGSYKTSTLRSIGSTAPYMHDGRFETLSEVIDHYVLASQQKTKDNDLKPISLKEKQKTDLISFLLSL